MCNRYQLNLNLELIRRQFSNVPDNWFDETDKRYPDFYPKSKVPVIAIKGGEFAYGNLQWGVWPSWAVKSSDLQTNTKIETVLDKPTWSESFRRRRILIPASGFYEPIKDKKEQAFFQLTNDEVFCFAGLWMPSIFDGNKINTITIMTISPNEIVGAVHPRMPLILNPDQYESYLTTSPENSEILLSKLSPYPSDKMKATIKT